MGYVGVAKGYEGLLWVGYAGVTSRRVLNGVVGGVK